jgi:acyl-CoA synthetase (AMP-forming)/AMP-acid ligase II
MLYERWREIAREHCQELALREFDASRQWTFGQLADEAERGELPDGPVSYPQGMAADFIFTLLRAWRAGTVVTPLEVGQKPIAWTGSLPEIVHLKTTSATTGAPRLIALTAPQLMADARNIVETMGLSPASPNLGVISLAHSYGFSNLVLPLLLHGVPLLLLEAPLPEMVRRGTAGFSNVTLAAVPALWRAWHEAEAIPSTVRLAISAGAPLPLNLENEIFQKSGLKLHNFYGASECGGIAYDATEQPRSDAACAGAPLRNVSLSIAEDGCLEVRGAAVAETYWPEPERTLNGGVCRTNDLADLIGARVYLRGRAGDQINVAGRKVIPEAIERVLRAHPLVRDCLVFGAPTGDQSRSEKIVAGVALHGAVSGESLKQFLLERLPAWQVPRDWWFVDSLAPNQRGKISRSEWRQRYVENG